MPQRNGYKSHRGRSAIARKTEFGGASEQMYYAFCLCNDIYRRARENQLFWRT